MTIVTLVSGCGNAYPGDGTRDGGGVRIDNDVGHRPEVPIRDAP